MTGTVFSAGALRIKGLLPNSMKSSYDHTKVLDKGGVKKLIAEIVLKGGEHAPNAISDVTRLFFDTATNNGYSTPISDYINDSDERDAIIHEFSSQIDTLNNDKNLNERQRFELIGEVTEKYSKKMVDQNLEYLNDRGSTAAKMAQTGARGDSRQLNQATGSPMMAKGIGGKPIPLAITRSFAQGLSPAEHLAMSRWGRANTVSAQLATSEPGAMFKRIAPNVYHDVVTKEDCGTKNGVLYDLSQKRRIVGCFEAGTNRFIDEAMYKDLVSSGVAKVKVRSTLTCESQEGVCKKCYGRGPDGNIVNIGDNVGMIAGQSLAEKLTQMILSTKHDAKAGKGRNPFYEAKNLIDNPSSFQDKATISKVAGSVSKITKNSLGDMKVFVNDIEHFVPNAQELKVKEGDTINQGDKLSTGTIDPKELVALRGLGAGRRYISNKLEKIYDGDLDPRHYDMMARNLSKYVRIDDPGESDFLPGQKVNVMRIHDVLKADTEEVPVMNAVGRTVAMQTLEVMPGTVLDRQEADDLKAKGIQTVKVSKSGLKVTPFIPGADTLKSLDPNWISRLAHNNLKASLEEGAVMGHVADIHGTDPIAPYIMGANFGEGKDGKY